MNPDDGSGPSVPDPGGLGNLFGSLFSDVPTFFLVAMGLMALIFVAFVVTLVWRTVRYARAPRMSSPAVCVGKRTQVSGSSSIGEAHSSSSTWYHATFELPDGQRLELGLSGRDYGQLAEGDRGILNWQDVVFKGFQRDLGAAGNRQLGGALG